MKNMKKSKKILIGILATILSFAVIMLCLPIFKYMITSQFQRDLVNFVNSVGVWGVLVLFIIQLLQIVIAIIPGEPIELVAGAMYGTFGGMLICLLGTIVSSGIIFYITRKLGKERIEKSKIYPKISKYLFLTNEKKLESMIFLLYFIPGTPKDILVYICAITNIPLDRFLAISTVARIPSVITSTMAGASFATGNLTLMILIFILTGIGGAIGIWYHNKEIDKKSEKNNKNK